MRAVLVSGFPDDYIRDDIVPELERRTVEVLRIVHPYKIERVDIAALRPDVVLHMTEWGSHAKSATLSAACRRAGIPVRSLSRKKASWAAFLPAPRDIPPPPPSPKPFTPVEEKPMNTPPKNGTAPTLRATIGDIPAAREVLQKAKEPPIPEKVLLEPTKDWGLGPLLDRIVAGGEVTAALRDHASAIRELAAAIRESRIEKVSREKKVTIPAEPKRNPICDKLVEIVGKVPGLTSGELFVLITGTMGGGLKDVTRNDVAMGLRRLTDAGKLRREGAGGAASLFQYFSEEPKS